MSKPNTRPFVPVGDFHSKKAADAAAARNTKEREPEIWKRCPSPVTGRYSIIRKA